jgi:hypothetical protein
VKKCEVKWTEIFQRKKYKWPKYTESMINISGQKGITNQNQIKIPPHFC